MHAKRISLFAALVATILSALAVIAVAATGVRWTSAVTEWHYNADTTHGLQVMMRQIGTKFDTVDDTDLVSFKDLGGNVETEHVSPYIALDLSPYIPSDAKVVKLSVKTLITKPINQGTADVFVFMRTPDSTCCQGPVESPLTPVDFSVSTNPYHLGEAAQSVLQSLGGIRDFTDNVLAVKDGKVEVAWGYQKQPGDALAFDVYLDGYGL